MRTLRGGNLPYSAHLGEWKFILQCAGERESGEQKWGESGEVKEVAVDVEGGGHVGVADGDCDFNLADVAQQGA